MAYSKQKRKDIILQNEPEAEHRAEDQGFSIRDNGILAGLEMMPFASIGQLLRRPSSP
jgi:hypothetical protein